MADRGAGGERGGEHGSLPWVRRSKRRTRMTRNKYVPFKGPGLSKASVAVGDGNGHVGLGVKCRRKYRLPKLSVIPVRRGYWGNKIGKPHTVPCKVTGKCGFVTVRTVPAPRGSTKTLGNLVKATFDCLLKTYGFLTPDFWTETRFIKSPFQEFTDLLAKPTKALVLEDVEA
ncbi:40S ribosomal protein [Salix suchowensis]|nr:40S ribosomal protein [Salix suchowensis]